MTKTVEVAGQQFKRLIAAATKFPNLGSFNDSEMVNLSCSEGYLSASAVGIVLTHARVKAEGSIDLVAVNERVLTNFASVVSDGAKVTLSRSGNEISLKSKKSEVNTLLAPGALLTRPKLGTPVTISGETAERLRYLAAIAYNDTSKAEICCVMLSPDGMAYAMDQKAVVVLSVPVGTKGPVPLPLALARLVEAGNRLYAGSKVTALKAGCGVYSMPSLEKARTAFPFGLIKELAESAGKVVGRVDGLKLAGAIDECVRCLGNLARTEAVCTMQLEEGKMRISASNGGARFSTRIAASIENKPIEFRVPLESMSRARPFFTGDIPISQNKHGDLFLALPNGWALFPPDIQVKKKKVTK